MPDVFEPPGRRPGVAGKRKRRSLGPKPYWIDEHGTTVWTSSKDADDDFDFKTQDNQTESSSSNDDDDEEPTPATDLLNHITPPTDRKTDNKYEQQIEFLEEQLQQRDAQIEQLENQISGFEENNNPAQQVATLQRQVEQQQAEIKELEERNEQEKQKILEQAREEVERLQKEHAEELRERDEEQRLAAAQQAETRCDTNRDVNLEKDHTLADLERTRARLVQLERERENELRSAVELEEMIVKKDREIFLLKKNKKATTTTIGDSQVLEQLKQQHAQELSQKDEEHGQLMEEIIVQKDRQISVLTRARTAGTTDSEQLNERHAQELEKKDQEHQEQMEELERVNKERAKQIDILNAKLEEKDEDIEGLNDKLESMGRSLVEKHRLWQQREISNKNLKKELTKAFKKIDNRNAKIDKLQIKLREAQKAARQDDTTDESMDILARLSELDSRVEDVEEVPPLHHQQKQSPSVKKDPKAVKACLDFDDMFMDSQSSLHAKAPSNEPPPPSTSQKTPKAPIRRRRTKIIIETPEDSDDEDEASV